MNLRVAGLGDVDCIHVSEASDQWLDLVNAPMKVRTKNPLFRQLGKLACTVEIQLFESLEHFTCTLRVHSRSSVRHEFITVHFGT
jgi:hypothetical protein